MNKKIAIVLLVLAAGCADKSMMSGDYSGGGSVVNPQQAEQVVPPMDPKRKIAEQDCGGPVEITAGNLLCMGPEAAERERRRRAEEERQRKLEAERRAKLAEEARLAKLKADAEERARLERERLERLAREEAARKAKLAEDERLAAEAKARAEREAREKAEAEARARALAAQQAREAAERECRRLEQERLDGRAVLEGFVANYGAVDEYKQIAGQISAFLARPHKPRPCP